MSVYDYCKKDIFSVAKNETVKQAAELMQKENVGSVVVVDEQDSSKPVGILTDRDIVLRALVDGQDVNSLKVEEVMTSDILLLTQSQKLSEALDQMCERKIRRAPIVDEDHKLCGIISTDDLVMLLGNKMNKLGCLIESQI